MRSTHLAALLLMLAAVAVGAPRKDSPAETLYLQTTVGEKKVFETTSGRVTSEFTVWVVAVEKKGAMTIVSFSSEEGGPVSSRFGASADGVFRLALGATSYDPPPRLLKLPANEGDTWEESLSARKDEDAKAKYTTGKEEEVVVPAGKFRAIRVECEYTNTDVNFARTTYWHVAGLGIVKTLTKSKGAESLVVLKSLTPGKK
jgi:hypothetical protein